MPDAEELLTALDPEQRRVATTLDGPVVVLAGAGTGKTRAITHRIAYACATRRYIPRATLAVTFTTRAAGELRGRLRELGVVGVQARTFHSAALRQAQYFWPRAFGAELPRIAENRMALVAEAAHRVRVPVDTPTLRDLVGEISWAKVSNVTMDQYAAMARKQGRAVASADPETVARIFTHYEEAKRERGVIDFDDILLCNAALLAERDDVAAEVRRTYRYFVVDEYQDVSPLQETVLRLWLGDRRDICVVGDPAQTIHSFAGARSSYLTGFTQRYPEATRITLVRDYRSTPQIVALANGVMQRQKERVMLESMLASGAAPIFTEYGNEADEAEGIARWLEQQHSNGIDYREMAVLFRINAQSPALEAALTARDIPYLIRGAERFYERAEVRRALATLHAIVKKELPHADPLASFREALISCGWQEDAPKSAGSARERWESLAALMAMAEDLMTIPEDVVETEPPTLAELVAELDQRAESQHAPVAQGVTLSTMHSAKGLEWDAVALFGIHEGSVPFVLATSPASIDEERRLLYVGITRAKHQLSVSWSRGKNGSHGSRGASRFLDGLTSTITRQGARTAKAKSTILAATCRVCSVRLHDAAERKLGRHLDCESSYDEVVYDQLRQWRKATATEAKLPAYCIFTDATLLAIAEAEPCTELELLKISGVGKSKLIKYGHEVLQITRR
ncbi:MAG: ATP-dependent DNA helicase UvrD2 [Propionibacteriaceae bacterium]